jgi:TP901 family phage tail tape measure protein
MALATRNLYLVLKARDEASRVLRGFGRELSRAGKLAQAENLRNRAAMAMLRASEMELTGATTAEIEAQKHLARTLRTQAQELERSHRQAVRLSNALHTVGSTLMTVGAGIAVAGAAGLAFLYSSVKVAQDYERQVRLTATQVDNFTASLDDLSAVGLRVAQNVAVPFEEIQPALYNILSSTNANLEQAEILLTGFAKTAVAGQVSIEDAARGTISIMNAFNIPLERVNDILDIQFQLVRKGVGTYEEFSKVFGRVVPSATRAHQSFATVAAMLAYLTRNGLSAAMASSAAARALDAMSHPTAIKNMEQLGIKVRDAAGNFLPLEQSLINVRKYLETLPTSGRVAALAEIFKGAGGTIQARRFLEQVLLRPGELEEFIGFLGDMNNASGAFEQAYGQMSNSVAAQSELLRNKWKVLQESVGKIVLPAFLGFIKGLQHILDWFNNLTPGAKKFVTMFILVGGAVGVVGGLVLLLLGALAGLFAAVMAAGASFFYLLGAVLLIVGAIGAFGAGLAIAIAKSKGFRDMLGSIRDRAMEMWNDAILPAALGIKNAFEKNILPPARKLWEVLDQQILPAWTRFYDALMTQVIPAVKEVASWVKDKLAFAFAFIGAIIKSVVIPALEFLAKYYKEHKETIDQIIGALIWFGKQLAKVAAIAIGIFAVAFGGPVIAIIAAFIGAILLIGAAVVGAVEGIKKLVNWVTENVPKAWSAVVEFTKSIWHSVEDFFVSLWGSIVGFFVGAWTKIVAAFQTAQDFIAARWNEFWNTKIGGLLKAVWGLILAIINLAWVSIQFVFLWGQRIITDAWNTTWNAVKTAVMAVWNFIFPYLKGIWDAIVSAFTTSWNAFVAGFMLVWSLVKNAAVTTWNALWGFLVMIWEAIRSAAVTSWNALYAAVKTPLTKAWELVVSIWNKIKDVFSGGGSWLFDAGKRLIQGLIDGITSMVNKVTDKINEIAKKIRDHFPFSPAKIGPLSGKGNLFNAGKNMVKQLQDGMNAMQPELAMSASGVAGGARGAVLNSQQSGTGGAPVQQVFNITTQEISPRRHAAQLGMALAGRR